VFEPAVSVGQSKRAVSHVRFASRGAAELAQFTGAENWYWCGLNRNILYTDGAQFVAESAGAYWLLDEIALANACNCSVKAEEFQVWTLTRNKTGNGAMLPGGSPIQLHDVSVMGAPLQ
jgi:hypothetical protein